MPELAQSLGAVRKFHFSEHAINRGKERGISCEEMKAVVNYSAMKRQQYRGNHGGIVWKFSKPLGNQTAVVVAEVKGSEAWIVSCFNQ